MPLKTVFPDRTTSNPKFEDLHKTYSPELPAWFHRRGLSKEQAKDATQTLWLIVAEKLDKMPTNPPDIKRALFRIASNVARNVERGAMRERNRNGATIPDELQGNAPNGEQLAFTRELLDAIDALPEHLREAFIANKILGRSAREIAAMTGLGEDNVLVRVWNACAQIQYKLGLQDERKAKRGVVIAPMDLEIPIETRGAFCAYWSITGTMPQFGGPKDPPPPPPPIPSFVNAAPIVSEAARGVTLRVNQTVLLLLLFLTSAGTVALIWIWSPEKTGTARAGLHVPQTPNVLESSDVVDVYPARAPAAPSAHASKAKPKSSQALDDDALDKLDGPGLTRSE